MSQQYTLIETSADEAWDQLVETSINGTLFSKSQYLLAAGVRYKLFYCYNKQELRAGVAVIESDDCKKLILDDLIIYNGIIYNQPANKQNRAQQLSEQFKIQTFVAEELPKLYEAVTLSLHSTIIDIRAFLWVNYGNTGPHYQPDVRYTSYIDISDFSRSNALDDISTYKEASTSRRQQVRYALNKGYKVITTDDSARFVDFYLKTMSRQEIMVDTQKSQQMQSLIDALIACNLGKIFACYDENEALGSMAFFGWDSKRAYYVFGANDPKLRNGHSGTAVLWEAFYALRELGIKEVDLEGVNSPHRGWFKLSFGGNITPYYEVSLGEKS